MFDKKGLTFLECLVLVIVLGALASFSIYNYITSTQQEAAMTAENNLITIETAQQKYFLSHGNYCLTSTASKGTCAPPYTSDVFCGGNLAAINCNLSTNVTDRYFTTYTCNETNGFTCTAESPFILGTGSLSVTNTPVILPGSPNCAPGGPAPCNPTCTAANYCPTS